MNYVFISYSHKDADYAHELANRLQNNGFNVWIDARLDYGSQWPQEIQRRLDACTAFILVMSPRSFDSEWVQSELQRAKRKLKPIFPLLLEGDEPWLSTESTQYYDVRGGIFPDVRFYSALKKVVPTSQNAQTFTSLPKPPVATTAPIRTEPKKETNKTRWVLAVLGGGAAFLGLCGIILLGIWLFPGNPPAAPVTQDVVITTTLPEAVEETAPIPITGSTQTEEPSPTVQPSPTKTPTHAATSPPSGTCKDGYVYRLINSKDRVCVSPSSKAQADADNAKAKPRKILAVLLEAYGEDACASGYVWRNAYEGDVVCVEPVTRDQAQADNAAASSRWVFGSFGADTCISGYVWRAATSNDHVCVTPEIRSQTAADNSLADSRKAVNVYDEDKCISGYVWREAFDGDRVCVTPEVRQQVAKDNVESPSHTWP